MAVVSFRELGRKLEYELAQPLKLTREFVCVLSDNTLENSPTTEHDVLLAIGIDQGSVHPTYPTNRCKKIVLTEQYEGSPYHTHVLYEYGPVVSNDLLFPTARAYRWECEASVGDTIATFFFDDSNVKRPLTNSAYDFFPGLTTGEGVATLRVVGNFEQWPGSWFLANNTLNNGTYAGCPAHTLKVTSVRCVPAVEQFGQTAYTFWRATAEIQFRQSGHALQLPDVGWNYITGGQKRRAMVFDFENVEWVQSPNPIGLNGAGAPSPTGWPAILNRRVNDASDFQALFGNFPTQPLAIS